MMPTMQEIDDTEEVIRKVLLLSHPDLSMRLHYLTEAARRGVEGDRLKAWDGDVPLSGPDAPKSDGKLSHLICYLLTVYERFGDTCVTNNLQLQWGSNALHKMDRQKEQIATLEAELAALKVERDEAVRREREAISEMASDLEEGQSVTTKLVLRLLTDRIRARNDQPEQSGPHPKGESDE